MDTKYVEVAKRCLDRLGQYNMDMVNFKTEDACGTSFCMLGDLAAQDGYPGGEGSEIFFDYYRYGEELIGKHSSSLEWEWLFDASWSNNLQAAKERCQYVIDNGKAPDSRDTRWIFIRGYED